MPELNQITCMVVDDEPLAQQLLTDYIHATPGLQLRFVTGSALAALGWLQKEPVDIMFLDIQMPELTGIQVMEIAGAGTKFILTTAYSEYALKGYDFDVVDYLLKPITFERFLSAVQKVRQRFTATQPQIVQHTDERSFVMVKTEYRMQKVNFSDIYYLEGMRDYVALHTAQGKIMTLQSLRSFEEQLPAKKFVRIHKSYLIAIEQIQFLEKGIVVVRGVHLPLGDAYRDAFLAALS